MPRYALRSITVRIEISVIQNCVNVCLNAHVIPSIHLVYLALIASPMNGPIKSFVLLITRNYVYQKRAESLGLPLPVKLFFVDFGMQTEQRVFKSLESRLCLALHTVETSQILFCALVHGVIFYFFRLTNMLIVDCDVLYVFRVIFYSVAYVSHYYG